jgi:hypothetical protein
MGKYAILLVLFLIVLLVTYNTTMNDLSLVSLTRNIETYNVNQARNIANSAVKTLLHRIVDLDDDTFYVSPDNMQYFPEHGYYDWEELNGKYRYHIENQHDTLFIITAKGVVYGSEYSVRILLKEEKNKLVFPLAAFASEELKMGGGFIKGDVATNAVSKDAVDMSGGATIDSVLYIGVGGDPQTVVKAWSDQAVSGGIENLSQPLHYPMPEFPDFPVEGNNQGKLDVKNKVVLQPNQFDNLYFEEINIGGNKDTLVMNVGDG